MSSHVKQPQPTFEVAFLGPGIAPERIPIRTLSDTMQAVQALTNGRGFTTPEERKTASIGLLKITRGSAGFQCVAPHPSEALNYLHLTGTLLAGDSKITDTTQEFILPPVETLSRIASSLQCRILLCPPRKRDEPFAVIDGESYTRVSEGVFVHGETSIRGQIKRVGGVKNMRCALRLPDRAELLYCDVPSSETARKLGQHLYQNVVAVGMATWFSRSWRLYSFKIQEIYQPKEQPVTKAFEELYEAGGKAWAEIENPEEYLREAWS